MTKRHETSNVTAPDPPVSRAEVSSRVARLLGAWRARSTAVAALKLQAQAAEDDEEPPVEWALRLMI